MLGVHVMGDVVSVKEKSALIIYEGIDYSYCLYKLHICAVLMHTSQYVCMCVCMYLYVCICSVDDGSGVLSCVQWRITKDTSDGLYVPDIGLLVSVYGQVGEYREEKQLRVTAIGEVVREWGGGWDPDKCPVYEGVLIERFLSSHSSRRGS